MSSLKPHFDLLKKRIEPNTDCAKIAQEMPDKVREHLQKHPDFATQTPHTRLSGSYARKTATKEIKDVDILVFVAQSWREKSIEELMDALYKALKDLPQTLGEGNEPELRRQRRSINVYLPDHDLYLDIVPVLKTTDSTNDQLEVPDREWDDWVFTHPVGHGCFLSSLNGDNKDKVVPVIKLIKHWRDVQFLKMKPKSYWLETLIVHHIHKGWVTTEGKGDGELILALFDSIYERFEPWLDKEEETPFIPDSQLRNHVAWNWKKSWFTSFMKRLDTSREWARTAVKATNDEEAIENWKKVFGDKWFPDAAEFKAMSELGLLSFTATGRVLFNQSPNIPSIPSPPKRFFGSE